MTERNSTLLQEIGKALIATLVATVSATWTARGFVADLDRRMSIIETRQQYSDANLGATIVEIRTDVRELRTEVRDVASAVTRGRGGN